MTISRTLYFVRHCRAAGQEPDAPLTAEGEQQAHDLAKFLAPRGISRIVSSPYTRATASITPLATLLGIAIETDERLIERVLSTSPLPDWQYHLRASFDDFHITLEGGESSHTAMTRAKAAIQDVSVSSGNAGVVIVTHGNLLSLIVRHFDPALGTFETWRALSYPDVFGVTYPHASAPSSLPSITRIWEA
jgi:2,3-bisphosphoglycerate-dependent phosphoglycerate mutase